jgi:hypothetical protein
MRSFAFTASVLVVLALTTAVPCNAFADEPAPVPAQEVSAPAPAPKAPGNIYLHANLAMNAYTYLGEKGAAKSLSYTPDDRVVSFQQLGVGYFVSKSLRLQVTFQVGETWSGIPDTASKFTLASVMPMAFYIRKRFSIGAGPMFAARSGGKTQFDAGAFGAVGYLFPLKNGFAISPVLGVAVLGYQRTVVAINPAVSLSYRF